MTKFFYEKYWENIKEAPPESDPLAFKRLKIFLDFIKNKDVKNILDFGCGAGFISNEFKKNGFNVVGVDISQNAISEAKRRFPGVNFNVISIDDKLPFEDNIFDAIYCAEVIEHIYNIEFLMQEFKRILKKDGMLFVSTPYHGFLKNLLITLFSFDKHFDVVGPHIRFFTKKSLSNLLKKYGFQIEEIKLLGRFWPIWMSMIFIVKKI